MFCWDSKFSICVLLCLLITNFLFAFAKLNAGVRNFARFAYFPTLYGSLYNYNILTGSKFVFFAAKCFVCILFYNILANI